jgi:hypothetical protein
LDESYFRYTSSADDSVQPNNSSSADSEKTDGDMDEFPTRKKRGRVDIVEGVGGKEGVEGVSVGAVNVYLVVFSGGIISVSPWDVMFS